MNFAMACSRFAVGTAAVSATLLLAACGGGGGSPTPGPAPTQPVSTAPSFTSAGSVSVIENTTGNFYTAEATDPQGDAITFSLFSGPDADKLVMDASGALRFNENPNFDLPIDANFDNVYEIRDHF